MVKEVKNTGNVLNDKRLFMVVQVSGWLLYFTIVCLIRLSMSNHGSQAFYVTEVLETIIGFFLTSAIRKTIIKRNILNKLLSSQVIQLVYLTFIYSFFFSTLYIVVFVLAGLYRMETANPVSTTWLQQWIYTFILVLIWNLLYFSYHYIQKSNKEALEKAKLESTVKDLELNTIKAHINPHFIFNALNSIRALVEEDPQRARLAITELSNLLRSSMQAEKRKTTTLEEELKIVHDYLALESIRFENRLRVQFHIDEELMFQEIPPMSLQTLVENAIKHGISKEINGGEIDILASEKLGNCYIQVKNTGKIETNRDREGFGVKSTVDRLELLFGKKASFSLNQNGANQVTATMKIPLSIKTQL